MGHRQTTGLCFIWKMVLVRKKKKKSLPPVYFSIFKTNVFAWPQNPPKTLFTQLYVQPSSNILYLTVHIPISH